MSGAHFPLWGPAQRIAQHQTLGITQLSTLSFIFSRPGNRSLETEVKLLLQGHLERQK